jgi:O-antigen/teichoic acid export membrane protein
MTGYERHAALIFLFAAMLNIALNILLIPLFGTMGAAFSTAGTMILWNIAAGLIVWKKLKIKPSFLGCYDESV